MVAALKGLPVLIMAFMIETSFAIRETPALLVLPVAAGEADYLAWGYGPGQN